MLFDCTDRYAHVTRDRRVAHLFKPVKHERLSGTFGQVSDCRDQPCEILLPLQDAIGRAYLNGMMIIFQRLVRGPVAYLIATGMIGQDAMRNLEQIGSGIIDGRFAAPGVQSQDDILHEIVDIAGRNASGQIPPDGRQQLRDLKIKLAARIVPYFRPEHQ